MRNTDHRASNIEQRISTHMQNPTEIVPGLLFVSYLSSARKEKVGFFGDSALVLQVSGEMKFETPAVKVTTKAGELLLIRKNQLAELTKQPLPGEDYQTMVIRLKEDLLRQIALEDQLAASSKYNGPSAIILPANDFLQGFFQSIMPYARHPEQHQLSEALGMLKVKEAVQLLLHAMPSLKEFLFDFSEPYKIDLEKFMLTNYHFNIPVEKFAQLTGRSLSAFKRDFQKLFDTSPRQWLQEKRLTEAKQLIERKQLKPSAIYLELGFESLSHFSHAFKKKFGKTPREWAV